MGSRPENREKKKKKPAIASAAAMMMSISHTVQAPLQKPNQKVKAYWLYSYLRPDGHMPCPAWQHMDIWTPTKARAAHTHTQAHTHTYPHTYAYTCICK